MITTEPVTTHVEERGCKVVLDYTKDSHTITVRNRNGKLIYSAVVGTNGATASISGCGWGRMEKIS